MVIDGITYDVPMTVLNRNSEILFKYAERTEDGVLHAEAIGTFYNYDVQVGQSENNPDDYDALWEKITDPNHEHTMVLPDSSGSSDTVSVYFTNAKDEVKKWYIGDDVFYRGLSFSIISIEPARTP